MEIIYIITSIVSVIVLIQYFVLCANVKGIKYILERPQASTNIHLAEYKKHTFWGNKELAAEKLKDAFWYDFTVLKGMNYGEASAKNRYEALVSQYEQAFKNNNITAPEWDGKS